MADRQLAEEAAALDLAGAALQFLFCTSHGGAHKHAVGTEQALMWHLRWTDVVLTHPRCSLAALAHVRVLVIAETGPMTRDPLPASHLDA